MMKTTPTAVQRCREEAGLTQAQLASEARLSRQSIHAIERGRAVPRVDVALRISAALGRRVEQLFGTESAERVVTTALTNEAVARVRLARVGGRWVSWGLCGLDASAAADALVHRRCARSVTVSPLRDPADLGQNTVLVGCSGALGLLADHLNRRTSQGRYGWVPASSGRALDALVGGLANVAGAHLTTEKGQNANEDAVRRRTPKEPVVLIALAQWDAGLLVAKGNPLQLHSMADVVRRRARFVARERGSGARDLTDRSLKRERLGIKSVPAAIQATSHTSVATAVVQGAADAGISTRDTAIAFDLGFVPLARERYDVVIPKSSVDEPRVARLLDVLTSKAFRAELSALGYDVTGNGDRVGDVGVSRARRGN